MTSKKILVELSLTVRGNKMKNTTIKQYLGVAFAVSLSISPLLANQNAQSDSYKITFAAVSALELPAKAAAIVYQAKDNQKAVAIAVMTAAIAVNPNSTVAVVAAISKSSPKMASVVATTAAKLQPKQIGQIAKAAAAAAPTEAEQVVIGLAKDQPKQYGLVISAVSQEIPRSAARINEAVYTEVPSLRPAPAVVGSSPVTIVASAPAPIVSSPAPLVQSAPTVFPPFTLKLPGGDTIEASTTGQVTSPEQANDYSAP